MTNEARAERLLAAREHLDAVLEDCDLTADDCTCGALRYKNWYDFTLFKKLQGMVEKIDLEVGKLRANVPPQGRHDG